MMMTIQQRPLLLLLLAGSWLVSLAKAQNANCSTITELACQTEGFEFLCEAIEATGLGDDLDGEMWTVFAPTNEAFALLSSGEIDMLMNDTVAMTNLLLFHVVPGEILFSADLECDGFLEMANGDLSETICAQNDTAFSQVGEGNSDADTYPDIVQVDLEACNGVIHVIDQVMLFENVTQAPILTDAPTVTVTTVPPETNAPTVAETEAPTASPTASETPSPTAAPTPGATSTAPSDNQLQEITDSPTESTTTTAPIASPTDAPVISPTDAPVIPSAPPVEAPVETPTAVDACQTVTEAACTNDDFSTLCAALTVTGLGDVLNVETDTFTVFAPTNDAFAKLGEAAIDYLLQPEQVQLLSEILLFHVIVDSAVKSTDLECAALYEMANAQESRTICREPVIYQKGAGNPDDARPEIITADLEVCNGVIHALSEVMLYSTLQDLGIPTPDPTATPIETTPPPAPVDQCQTLDEIICGEEQFSAFCQSLRKTGFDIALSQDTWTVFAPTNEAIVRLGHGALNSISLEELAQVLSFHLVPDRTLLKEDLPCVAGQNLVKMASGRNSRTLCQDDENRVPQPTWQKGAGNPDDDKPAFESFDKIACNGVIHTIDGVLLHFPLPE